MRTPDKPTREQYEAAAKANGWVHSPAHDGWVHDDEIRDGKYMVQHDAEDACWFHEIEVDPDKSVEDLESS